MAAEMKQVAEDTAAMMLGRRWDVCGSGIHGGKWGRKDRGGAAGGGTVAMVVLRVGMMLIRRRSRVEVDAAVESIMLAYSFDGG